MSEREKREEEERGLEPVKRRGILRPRTAQTETPRRTATRAVARLTTELRQGGEWLRSPQTRRRITLLFGRMTSHVAILFVSVVAVTLAGLRLGSAAIGGSGDVALQQGSVGRSPTVLSGSGAAGSRLGVGFQQAGASGADGSIILRDAAVVFDPSSSAAAGASASGAAVERRGDLTSYIVQPGDVIESIARKFGLQPTSIVWANQAIEDNPDLLKVGQELTILPVDGIYYTVKSGDTLAGIARRFKVEPQDILREPLNGISDESSLMAGAKIIVPNGVKGSGSDAPAPSRRIAAPVAAASGDGSATGAFIWPTNGYISQGFWSYHRGIDIANSIGTQIAASDGGYVQYAGWSNVGYGYMVLINHGNGFSSLYAHLSYYYVDVGQYVSKGQVLGLMGSTGNSTGPHLHFEIRYGGGTQNPFSYLP
jgi:murein DD-endopeptidase MepM/ murein hydrolase activator NlpD